MGRAPHTMDRGGHGQAGIWQQWPQGTLLPSLASPLCRGRATRELAWPRVWHRVAKQGQPWGTTRLLSEALGPACAGAGTTRPCRGGAGPEEIFM